MSALAFFSSAASSFQPAPYTPSSASRPPPRTNGRSNDSLAVPPPGMDPQPTDPNVIFIHSPFTTFPNSHLHPDGLTYALMADNPEWFLDALDFFASPCYSLKSPMPYPPHLEPPRGWCPAKKKDLKDRGGDGWPEGEEPRLRCTFCRRTYAGVNAKSMWRRHVFEKHKIPMSNRRDSNTDRPRGRGSGKENRNQASSRSRDDTHDSLVTMVVAPQTAPQVMSHKSRFRTSKPVSEVAKRRRADRDIKKEVDEHQPTPSTSQVSQQDQDPSDQSESESETEAPARTFTPPLTPHADTSSDPPYILSSNSDELIPKSPALFRPIIPESPYNPLQTPSFRHSPARLPSDQPWRFPSPSHPLHSNTRDISLTMVSRPLPSPVKRGLSGASPSMTAAMLALNSSPISSPAPTVSRHTDFETPARPGLLFSKPINIPHFLKSQFSFSPLTSASKQYSSSKRRLLGSSPFRKPMGITHKKQSSEYSDTWFSEDSLATSSSIPLTAPDSDPFSIYDSWPHIGDDARISPVRLPKTSLEAESPVLRSGALPTVTGLAIGLLEPFGFPKEDPLNQLDADINLLSREEPRLDGKRPALSTNVDDNVAEDSPPLKKRRRSIDSPNS